jgi:imidazolonepropionase-like amidohydrolase
MLAIRVATIFDGTAVVPGCDTVLVDGRQIVGVRPYRDPDPPDCESIDFPGAMLLPGLIDTHVHLCGDNGDGALERLPGFGDEELRSIIEKSLAEHLAVGVTTVRDLGDRRWAVVDWRAEYADHSSLPTILASGPPITSVRGHCWNMGGEAAGPDALRNAVAVRADRGGDIVKIMASGGATTPGTDIAALQFTVEELATVVQEAHSRGLQVTAHAHALTAIEAALAAGTDGIEHCSFVTETGMDASPEVVEALAAAGVQVCPTLGMTPGSTPPPAVLELLRKSGMTYESRQRDVARMHSAGVRLISGSDGGIGAGKPHGILPGAVIDLAVGGVPAPAALASATSLAAQACGVGERKGRVAAGYDADLLMVDGDATADITALRRPVAVFLRGSRTS